MTSSSGGGDFFDKVRSFAAAVILAAAAAATLGTVLDWVRITERPNLAPDADFGDVAVETPTQTEPFNGLEARDGWWVLAAAAVLVVAATLLVLRRKSVYGWLAFFASILMGSIAVADYRGIGDLSSSISQRMQIVGEAEAGIGLTLVAAAALIGLVGSLAAVAASPRRDPG